MKECRKRQVERRGDEVNHRCVHKKADAYRTHVDASVCDSCPMRVYVERMQPKKPVIPGLPVLESASLYPSCEFRLVHDGKRKCGVTGLEVSPEQCNRCAKDSKMETAKLTQKAVNYLTAVRKWIAAGRPVRTEEEIKEIYEKHCSRCSMYDKERQVCNSCGCPANNSQPALRNKLAMATEECPLGQFGPKVKTDV